MTPTLHHHHYGNALKDCQHHFCSLAHCKGGMLFPSHSCFHHLSLNIFYMRKKKKKITKCTAVSLFNYRLTLQRKRACEDLWIISTARIDQQIHTKSITLVRNRSVWGAHLNLFSDILLWNRRLVEKERYILNDHYFFFFEPVCNFSNRHIFDLLSKLSCHFYGNLVNCQHTFTVYLLWEKKKNYESIKKILCICLK